MTPAAVPQAVENARAVIWDFDGVVADTEPAQARAYEVVLRRAGVDVAPGWFAQWVGTPESGIWAGLKDRYGLAASVGALSAVRAEIYGELAADLLPAWFVEPVLGLPVRHSIVSAGNHRQIVALLHQWGLEDAFAEVAATGSPQVPTGQPKIDRLRQAARVKGSVLFEDSPRYLAAVEVAVKVGVEHRFNDLSGASCDLLVAHDRPGGPDGGWRPATPGVS